ncbi:hypothetical protein ACFU3O_09410 [Streptomyces antibioticus]|uniref:hypothetical protein n=1 Tax=Streptomyces antibioticus TaxID=1890 RepID=UPI0036B9C08D
MAVVEPGLHYGLGRSLRSPDMDNDPLWLFSRFDPAEAEVVGDVVRTRGRMT